MTRRRPDARPRARRYPDGTVFLDLFCATGKGDQPHGEYRIAKVAVVPRPAGEAPVVRVDYVHPEDEDADPVRPLPDDVHMTWLFPCKKCRRSVPLRDANLAAVVLKLATIGVARLELRHLR